jgi:P2-related tail formation protein
MKMQLRGAKKQVIDLDKTMEALSRRAAIFLAGGVAGIGFLVREAANAEEVMSKFNAVFKESAESVRAWAEELAEATGRSKFEIQAFAAQLQDTFVPLGFARDQAAALSKQLTTLAIDLGSFNNMAEPEVINLLNSALVGNHEAVRRFGIIITEATLKQELANMGMEKAKGQAMELAKVQARLNIIMRSTTDAQGDAVRTADSTANQMKALKSEFKGAAVEMGQAFLPVAREVLAWLRSVVKWFSDLTDEQKRQIAEWVVFALKLAAATVVVSKLMKGVQALRAGMLLLNTAMKANPVLALVAGVTALVTVIWQYVNATDAAAEAEKKANDEKKKALELTERRAAADKRHAENMKKIADAQADANTKTAEANKLLGEAAKFEEDRAKKDKTPEQLNQLKREEGIKRATEAIKENEAALKELREQQLNVSRDEEGRGLRSKAEISGRAAAEEQARLEARKKSLPEEIKMAEEALGAANLRRVAAITSTASPVTAPGVISAAGDGDLISGMEVIRGREVEAAKAALEKLKAEQEGLKHAEAKLKISQQEAANAKAALKANEEAIKQRRDDIANLQQSIVEAQKAASEAEARDRQRRDALINQEIEERRNQAIEPFKEVIKEFGGIQTTGITGLQGMLQSQAEQTAKKAEKQRQEQIKIQAQIEENTRNLNEQEMGVFAP